MKVFFEENNMPINAAVLVVTYNAYTASRFLEHLPKKKHIRKASVRNPLKVHKYCRVFSRTVFVLFGSHVFRMHVRERLSGLACNQSTAFAVSRPSLISVMHK
jgi:hypothetical protein